MLKPFRLTIDKIRIDIKMHPNLILLHHVIVIHFIVEKNMNRVCNKDTKNIHEYNSNNITKEKVIQILKRLGINVMKYCLNIYVLN